jgi:hypothetical protein
MARKWALSQTKLNCKEKRFILEYNTINRQISYKMWNSV